MYIVKYIINVLDFRWVIKLKLLDMEKSRVTYDNTDKQTNNSRVRVNVLNSMENNYIAILNVQGNSY